MTTEQNIIGAKAGLLDLTEQLGNVSQACKIMGYSRDSFYRFQELYDKGGELALQEFSRCKADAEEPCRARGRASSCRHCHRATHLGQVRVANELLKRGISVSPFGVRCISHSMV